MKAFPKTQRFVNDVLKATNDIAFTIFLMNGDTSHIVFNFVERIGEFKLQKVDSVINEITKVVDNQDDFDCVKRMLNEIVISDLYSTIQDMQNDKNKLINLIMSGNTNIYEVYNEIEESCETLEGLIENFMHIYGFVDNYPKKCFLLSHEEKIYNIQTEAPEEQKDEPAKDIAVSKDNICKAIGGEMRYTPKESLSYKKIYNCLLEVDAFNEDDDITLDIFTTAMATGNFKEIYEKSKKNYLRFVVDKMKKYFDNEWKTEAINSMNINSHKLSQHSVIDNFKHNFPY
jgi:hypothetical protein